MYNYHNLSRSIECSEYGQTRRGDEMSTETTTTTVVSVRMNNINVNKRKIYINTFLTVANR